MVKYGSIVLNFIGGQWVKGQIRKALSGFYYVVAEDTTYQTRGRGNFRKRKLTPLVGDWVEFESSNLTDGYILDLLPRKNELVRPPVANVDLGIVVISMVEPAFSYNLLDRFLVNLEYKEIEPVIYLSKLDLLQDTQQLAHVKAVYEKIGYKVIASENEKVNIAALKKLFKDKLSVFMGQSGAGKSTLLNKIRPDLKLATAAISDYLGRENIQRAMSNYCQSTAVLLQIRLGLVHWNFKILPPMSCLGCFQNLSLRPLFVSFASASMSMNPAVKSNIA